MTMTERKNRLDRKHKKNAHTRAQKYNNLKCDRAREIEAPHLFIAGSKFETQYLHGDREKKGTFDNAKAH